MTTLFDVHLEENITKQLIKLLGRIERSVNPVNSLEHSNVPYQLDEVLRSIKRGGKYLKDFTRVMNGQVKVLTDGSNKALKTVRWDDFIKDITRSLARDSKDRNSFLLPEKVSDDIEAERNYYNNEEAKTLAKLKLRDLQNRNGLPVISGAWRKKAFPPRRYHHINSYIPTSSISRTDADTLTAELVTPLEGFLGQAYNYDDCWITEQWMQTFRDKDSVPPSDDEIIRTQVEILSEILLGKVQDRVLNDTGVLHRPPIGLGVALEERPVWGLDSYTRRMVELAIEDKVPSDLQNASALKYFVERLLLPSINAQAPDKAHSMAHATKSIIDQCDSSDNPDSMRVYKAYADALLASVEELGSEPFKIHPKGTGVICVAKGGIPAHVVVSDYLGELYPPYRWCERQAVVEKAQKKFELKPTLPDFYNILLERPKQDPNGYGLIFVDASQKANMGSSCSHSCNANCSSSVVARNDQLVIVLTTNRPIHYGEELTMDYYSVTTSEIEWRAAVCLCGMTSCRGSFLNYTTQDDLQQILNQNNGPVLRYASLLRACSDKPLSKEDGRTIDQHGMRSSALGKHAPRWVTKYAADILRFIEFERKALPCALLRSKGDSKSLYTFSAADADARCVMEMRIQSMVCCFSTVEQVLSASFSLRSASNHSQSSSSLLISDRATSAAGTAMMTAATGVTLESSSSSPLRAVPALEAAQRIERMLSSIPTLLRRHLLDDMKHSASRQSQLQQPQPLDGCSEPVASKDDSVKTERITALIQNIEEILKKEEAPKGLSWMKSTCLLIRRALLSIEEFSTKTARLGLLADVLALWAHTSNFSVVQSFDPVYSDPITVPARELGSSILRSKILKPDVGSRRKRTEDKVASDDDDDLLPVFTAPLRSVQQSQISYTDTDSQSSSTSTGATAAVDPPVGVLPHTSIVEDPACAMLTSDSIPETVPSSNTESVTTEEASSLSSSEVTGIIEEENAGDTTTSSGTSSASFKLALCDSGADAAASSEGNDDGSSVSHRQTTSATTSRADLYLDPNEPIYMGRKYYNEYFIFWQVMGWFNAGTDQREEQPHLFGCVQLPEPTLCFGPAEEKYGKEQRRALLAHLRDEKAQAMPWPRILTACFSAPADNGTEAPAFVPSAGAAGGHAPGVTSGTEKASRKKPKLNNGGSCVHVDDIPLFGTPVLDMALGQIGNVAKVIEEIVSASGSSLISVAIPSKKSLGRSTAANASLAQAVDNTQLDSILAPEQPTEWVQCETCRKWRRLPYDVDVTELPDEWVCSMNYWNPETASCEYPQDQYNPEIESTVQASIRDKSQDKIYRIGDWYDVYCTKNEIFYEAQVRKIKDPKSASEKKKILFHFKGWSPKFDEWVAVDSDRICAHNFHTNPVASKPREQEVWQGLNLYASEKPKKNVNTSGNSGAAVSSIGSTAVVAAVDKSPKEASVERGMKKRKATAADGKHLVKENGKKRKSESNITIKPVDSREPVAKGASSTALSRASSNNEKSSSKSVPAKEETKATQRKRSSSSTIETTDFFVDAPSKTIELVEHVDSEIGMDVAQELEAVITGPDEYSNSSFRCDVDTQTEFVAFTDEVFSPSAILVFPDGHKQDFSPDVDVDKSGCSAETERASSLGSIEMS